jgi:hypothetical protein
MSDKDFPTPDDDAALAAQEALLAVQSKEADAKRVDAVLLKSLRVQFEAVSDELGLDLVAIIEWLASGGAHRLPKEALEKATMDMNEVHYLLGEIAKVQQRSEHPIWRVKP